MHKFRIFYRENKEKIWKVLGIAILIYVLIRLMNNFIIQENKDKESSEGNNVAQTNSAYMPSKAIISDSTVSTDETEKNTKIIDTFINYCNENKIEEAYNILSEDCKSELFKTIQDFYNDYYKDIFTEKKSYNLSAWINYGTVTYKVKILNDILSSGKVDEEYIEDYYTVITENGEKKLSINGFVKKEEINKEKEVNGIKILVLDKYIYMDYEQYTIKITNDTDIRATIDTKENTETVFLTDTNGVTYSWYGHEVDNNDLILNGKENKTLNIKFNKMYNSNRKNKKISFTDIKLEGKEENTEIEIGI